jgi:hypothetical protein
VQIPVFSVPAILKLVDQKESKIMTELLGEGIAIVER